MRVRKTVNHPQPQAVAVKRIDEDGVHRLVFEWPKPTEYNAKVVKGEEAGEAATPLNEGAPEPEGPAPVEEPEADEPPPED